MDTVNVLVGGLISGVVVALAQAWFQRNAWAKDVREQRRREAARVVGPVLSALRDLEPEPNIGVLRGNVRAPEALSEKWERWLAAAGGIEVLGATHPGTNVATLCDSIITDGTKLLGLMHWAISNGEAQSERWWAEIKALHEGAMQASRNLVLEVLDQPA